MRWKARKENQSKGNEKGGTGGKEMMKTIFGRTGRRRKNDDKAG